MIKLLILLIRGIAYADAKKEKSHPPAGKVRGYNSKEPGGAAGGLAGHFAGQLFRGEQQDALSKVCGVSVLFIATAFTGISGLFLMGIRGKDKKDTLPFMPFMLASFVVFWMYKMEVL